MSPESMPFEKYRTLTCDITLKKIKILPGLIATYRRLYYGSTVEFFK